MAENQLTGDSGINTDIEIRKLSQLRVSDLKAELKRRNLDTGGNKSALMERLKKKDCFLASLDLKDLAHTNIPEITAVPHICHPDGGRGY
ncbi:scaffold attachment factor B2-like isoform X3 [Hyperolius riggenbachi]|uniref:scaffold attachment factor B2-like isoform X3 n=1 Tax=Hyperolius riggenbachi TaxID=752182 RepID=UPI0035A27FBC